MNVPFGFVLTMITMNWIHSVFYFYWIILWKYSFIDLIVSPRLPRWATNNNLNNKNKAIDVINLFDNINDAIYYPRSHICYNFQMSAYFIFSQNCLPIKHDRRSCPRGHTRYRYLCFYCLLSTNYWIKIERYSVAILWNARNAFKL